jgi:hypothetical protein
MCIEERHIAVLEHTSYAIHHITETPYCYTHLVLNTNVSPTSRSVDYYISDADNLPRGGEGDGRGWFRYN